MANSGYLTPPSTAPPSQLVCWPAVYSGYFRPPSRAQLLLWPAPAIVRRLGVFPPPSKAALPGPQPRDNYSGYFRPPSTAQLLVRLTPANARRLGVFPPPSKAVLPQHTHKRGGELLRVFILAPFQGGARLLPEGKRKSHSGYFRPLQRRGPTPAREPETKPLGVFPPPSIHRRSPAPGQRPERRRPLGVFPAPFKGTTLLPPTAAGREGNSGYFRPLQRRTSSCPFSGRGSEIRVLSGPLSRPHHIHPFLVNSSLPTQIPWWIGVNITRQGRVTLASGQQSVNGVPRRPLR
jgi:hypothetical protein